MKRKIAFHRSAMRISIVVLPVLVFLVAVVLYFVFYYTGEPIPECVAGGRSHAAVEKKQLLPHYEDRHQYPEIHIGAAREQLEKSGFFDRARLGYTRDGPDEWLVFDNWRTEDPHDHITFHIVDGEIRSWYVRKKE